MEQKTTGRSKGNLLYHLRVNKELTQNELAEALGVTQSMISAIELDKRDAGRKLSKKIAAFFNVNIEEII